MNWFVANIPFFILLIYLVFKIVTCLKKGAVKELCSVISITIASALVLLIAFAFRKYFDEDMIIFIVTVILLILLVIVYKIINLFLSTLKLISKLPVVSFVNKIIAIPLAICEVVILVWVIYCLTMVLDAGHITNWILECVKSNPVMEYLYLNNLVYSLLSNSAVMASVDIISKLAR